MIQVGIVGGAGYTAGELIRLLINHPNTNINFVYSTSNAGNKISKIHQDLVGSLDVEFTDTSYHLGAKIIHIKSYFELDETVKVVVHEPEQQSAEDVILGFSDDTMDQLKKEQKHWILCFV